MQAVADHEVELRTWHREGRRINAPGTELTGTRQGLWIVSQVQAEILTRAAKGWGMPTGDGIAHIDRVVMKTLAYAAGVSESAITRSTKLHELGIDSVAMFGAGMVLQAELAVEIADHDIRRIFTAGDVAESIALAAELQVRGGD